MADANQSIASVFEIIKEGNHEPTTGTLPSGAKVIGLPMSVASYDADTGIRTFALTDNDGAPSVKIDGFLTRAVQTTVGSGTNHLLYGMTETGGSLDTPFEQSKPGTIKMYDEIVVEGSDYIDSSITANTAVDTHLVAASGKWYTATTNDWVQFVLVAQLTPITAGNVRIRIKRCEGFVHA